MGEFSAIFPIECFNQASLASAPFPYTKGYCTGCLIILLASILMFTMSVVLLVWHFKNFSPTKCKTYLRQRTWSNLLLNLYMFILIMRFLFTLETKAFQAFLLALGQFIQSILLYVL